MKLRGFKKRLSSRALRAKINMVLKDVNHLLRLELDFGANSGAESSSSFLGTLIPARIGLDGSQARLRVLSFSGLKRLLLLKGILARGQASRRGAPGLAAWK